MCRILFVIFGLVFSKFFVEAKDYYVHSWTKIHANKHFWAEGGAVGDFNRDGHGDLVVGPYWYAGPAFEAKHEIYPAVESFEMKDKAGELIKVPGFPGAISGKNGYSKNFLCYVYDLNSDGWDDVLVMGFPGKESPWYENPKGKPGLWKKHISIMVTDNESPHFTDITGDGKPEIVCNSEGYFIYAEPNWKEPEKKWKIHRVTAKGKWQRFTHGMGVGDINGDNRKDIMDMNGWWEQPESLESDSQWKFHPFKFSPGGGAHMYAYDVDGDGDNDVITSIAAHGYGLCWYEHQKKEGRIHFVPHTFMNAKPNENRYGVKFSQLHAIDLVDMNRDGLMDIVTGKRFWAHGPNGDAEPNAPAVLYWFELQRNKNNSVDWIPHLVDADSGIGTQVMAKDINGDDWPDIVVGNKKGAFVHLQNPKKVSRKEWLKARPIPYKAD